MVPICHTGGIVPDVGTFRITIELEHPERRGSRVTLHNVLVDTGAELSWVPTRVLESLGVRREKTWLFRQADGSELSRDTGVVIVYAAGTVTTDEVVFGAPGDLVLLGARTLEGLNLRVEPTTKRLVNAGPAPAAIVTGPDASDQARSFGCPSQTVLVTARSESSAVRYTKFP
jgi:predicted aspartyl protease